MKRTPWILLLCIASCSKPPLHPADVAARAMQRGDYPAALSGFDRALQLGGQSARRRKSIFVERLCALAFLEPASAVSGLTVDPAIGVAPLATQDYVQVARALARAEEYDLALEALNLGMEADPDHDLFVIEKSRIQSRRRASSVRLARSDS